MPGSCPSYTDQPCYVEPALANVRDIHAALHWYRMARALGSRWAARRIAKINKRDEAPAAPDGYFGGQLAADGTIVPGTQKPCGSPEFFCKAGTRVPVRHGYYSTGGTPETRTGQQPCGSPKWFCQSGMRHSVGKGFYSVGDVGEASARESCGDASHYCNGDGVRRAVRAGHYSTGGVNKFTRTQTKPCGSFDDATANRFYCPPGGHRYAVPPQFYSTGGGPTTRTGIRACEPGFICENGQRRAAGLTAGTAN